MDWWHIRHKEEGSEQFVCSLDGIDQEKWEITLLDREPNDADDFIDGRLVRNEERAAELAVTSQRNGLKPPSVFDLLERIESLGLRLDEIEQAQRPVADNGANETVTPTEAEGKGR